MKTEADQVLGSEGGKWRLLLPGASEPRLTAAKTARACRLGYSNRLRGLSNRSIVVICNYDLAR
jgi:hypothetical protein